MSVQLLRELRVKVLLKFIVSENLLFIEGGSISIVRAKSAFIVYHYHHNDSHFLKLLYKSPHSPFIIS